MATNIPPHNLGEVIDACCALIDDPEITIDALIENHIQGPDFPTGAIVLGKQGIRLAYHTGRGAVIVRGRTSIEEIRKDREAIIISEIPYQVNKARMVMSGSSMRAQQAPITSPRLWGGMLVAMPTAIPPGPRRPCPARGYR